MLHQALGFAHCDQICFSEKALAAGGTMEVRIEAGKLGGCRLIKGR